MVKLSCPKNSGVIAVLDKDAAKFLKDIARLDARRWAKNDSIEIKHFFERLSVALQRGNASLLINRDADVNCI